MKVIFNKTQICTKKLQQETYVYGDGYKVFHKDVRVKYNIRRIE